MPGRCTGLSLSDDVNTFQAYVMGSLPQLWGAAFAEAGVGGMDRSICFTHSFASVACLYVPIAATIPTSLGSVDLFINFLGSEGLKNWTVFLNMSNPKHDCSLLSPSPSG